MARPKKQTVDYFPHDCTHKKTIFILEQRYGNDGYAFWFKLLELLGDTEKHYIDLNESEAWEFLQAKTHLSGDMCKEILDLLSKLNAIDPELWQNKVIWSDNFIERIATVYNNRRQETPEKPSFYKQKPSSAGVSTKKTPQSKVKESKVKENIYTDEFEEFWKHYPKKVGKGEAFKMYQRLKKRPGNEVLIAMVKKYEQSPQWKRDSGQYIPNPATWLNQRRFDDEVDVKKEETQEPKGL